MGNTFFYRDVKNSPNKITFKEILSECRKKHSRRDFDYQLFAGAEFNTATEQDMLKKWQKPWMFYKFLTWGMIIMATIFIFDAIANKSTENGFYPGTTTIAIVVPPLIIPLVITIFLWELNIPRNLTVYEVLLSFITGGVIAFFCNMVFRMIGSDKLDANAAYAGIFEEPAKLVAALVLMFVLFKNKKIYGMTGLVLGAAAGAGFGAFESVWYTMNNTVLSGDYNVAKFFFTWRFIGGFGMHTVWCAGYSGAVALNTKKSKLSGESILNMDFLIMFAAAIVTHYINNSSDVYQAIGMIEDDGSVNTAVVVIFQIALVVIEWFVLLYIIRKSLYQVVSLGRYHSGEGIGYTEAVGNLAGAQMAASVAGTSKITVVGMSGALRGAVWQSTGGDVLTIGRDDGNRFKIPSNVAGISRQHCVIKQTANGWVITDLNSSYGTSVNQVRIAPGTEQPLREGDLIYLGGSEQSFKVSFQS